LGVRPVTGSGLLEVSSTQQENGRIESNPYPWNRKPGLGKNGRNGRRESNPGSWKQEEAGLGRRLRGDGWGLDGIRDRAGIKV
jgi:hypothetical protein